MSRYPYLRGVSPPGPGLPARLSSPASDEGVVLRVLLDTGADVSLITPQLAVALSLPQVDERRIAGLDGVAFRVPVYALRVEVPGLATIVRAPAAGSEALLGRDILNQLRVSLLGPERVVEVPGPAWH